MEKQPAQEAKQNLKGDVIKATGYCIAGYFIPGLGHALQKKFSRAAVFFACILIMAWLGLYLQGRLYGPMTDDIFTFTNLKFFAEAGAGLAYWIPMWSGSGGGDPRAYTYDYANLFLYVAGLLNMLVLIDVFDIALGRKE